MSYVPGWKKRIFLFRGRDEGELWRELADADRGRWKKKPMGKKKGRLMVEVVGGRRKEEATFSSSLLEGSRV